MPTIEAGPASPARPFSATGGPQFRLGLGFFLVRGPDLLARLSLLRLLDDRLGILEAIPERCIHLFVGDLDPELVGGSLEQQLAGNGRDGLFAQPRDEFLSR